MRAMQAPQTNFVIKPRPTDYIKGVNSPIVFKAVTDGTWTSRLEFFENQSLSSETYGCELFTAQESFDAQMDEQIAKGLVPADMLAQLHAMDYMDLGLDGLPHFHSSSRFLESQTGNGFNGNSGPDPWDAMRKFGVLPWTDLPYNATITQAEYLTGVTPAMLTKAAQFLALIGGKDAIQYHWVQNGFPQNMAAMVEALPQAPLCIGVPVIVPGWNQVTPVAPPMTQPPQHSVLTYAIVNGQSKILDHYSPYEKVLDANYPIPYVLQGVVTIIAQIESQIISTTANIVTEVATAPISNADKFSLLKELEAVATAISFLFKRSP
jgi:hypothetical protein